MDYEVKPLELMKAGGELDGVWSTNLKAWPLTKICIKNIKFGMSAQSNIFYVGSELKCEVGPDHIYVGPEIK